MQKTSMGSFWLGLMMMLLLPAAAANEPRQLVFLSWADYIDPSLIEKFEQQYQAEIVERHFEDNDARDRQLLTNNAQGVDVALVNGDRLPSYQKRNWLQALDHSQVSNLRHVDAQWKSAFENAEEYGAPYFWGTLGIAYRKDIATEAITSWQQLFNPEPALRGRIVMLNSRRELIGAALKANGHSNNSIEPAELHQAATLLKAQRPYVADYGYVSFDSAEASLATGEIAAAMIFNGDAVTLQGFNENIVFSVPKEGTALWVDYLVVMREAPEPTLAHAFINFLNEPEHAAQLARYLNFASPNLAANKTLPDTFLNNRNIYPDTETLSRSEFDRNLPASATRMRNQIFAAITR